MRGTALQTPRSGVRQKGSRTEARLPKGEASACRGLASEACEMSPCRSIRSSGGSDMKRTLVAISLIALVSTVVLAQEPTVLPQADAAKYAPAPFPPGSQQAIVVGNPKNAEAYIIRVKLAKGTKVAPHTHPNDENVTVISGTFHIGVGEKFDEAKGQAVKAGGLVNVPKGRPHFAWVSEDSVIQLHGVGPAGATFVNPADAPK